MKQFETEFNDFLVTMRLVHAVHGKSSRAVRYTANQMLQRFKTDEIRRLCASLVSDIFAYNRYLTIERELEK